MKRFFHLALFALLPALLFSAPVNVQRVGGAGADAFDVTTNVSVPAGKTLDIDGTITGDALATLPVSTATQAAIEERETDVQFQSPLMAKWRAALGKLGSGLSSSAKICLVGDSTTAGAWALGTAVWTNQRAYSYPVWFTNQLNSGGMATDASAFCGRNIDTVSLLTAADYDPRITLTSGWDNSNSTETLGGRFFINTTTTSPLSFYPGTRFDRIEYSYATSPGNGSFTVAVNGGGALVTVNSAAAAGIGKATISCTSGFNTVNVARVSGGVLLLGVRCYNSTAKTVTVVNCGYAGQTAAQQAASGSFSPMSALVALAPDLTVIQTGINDLTAGTSAATYKANLTTIATQASSTGSVIIATWMPFSHANYATLAPGYLAAMKEVAEGVGAVFLDTATRDVSYSATNALGIMGDTIHPNRAGYSDFAGMVARETLRYSGNSAAMAASQVANTPAGNIVATTVQAMGEELDSEKAALASPTLTGIPAAPTAAVDTNTTQLATTAYVVGQGYAKTASLPTATTPITVYAAGTVYSLTASDALVDFGTTDPTSPFPTAGTYLVQGRAFLRYNAATYAGTQTATIHLRRTNNTPADVANATTTATLRIITTLTDTVGVMPLPPVIYTATAGDIISVYGSVSATPAAGSVDCTEASIVAIRLY